jgi:NAD+ synthetase
MKIALAQINTTVGDIRGNRDLVLDRIGRAVSAGADLVVYPELCLTGYPPKDLLGTHGFVEANLAAVRFIAERTGATGVVLGFIDRNELGRGKDFYNAAAVLWEGRIHAVIRKTLLPTYDVFDEERYFEKSRETVVVPFREHRLGISICEDAWNADEFWPKRLYETDPIANLVGAGADLLLNISASPFEMEKSGFRQRMLLEHVRRHRVPLLYLNLVGGNDDLLFDGSSLAFSGSGQLVARGKAFEEDLIVVDTEAGSSVPPEETNDTASLFNALVMGTRDYARKCGFRSAVLGLSGGIDSAVTACIAAEAFGPTNVLGVSMPSAYSAQESHDDARDLARNLGIAFEVIPIQPVVLQYLESLGRVFGELPPDTTEENLQARVRGNLLMALSNKFGHLLLSTGNKSELGVGYCTLYGDMAGGLAVISDVPKTRVYRLARHINQRGAVIPENTILRPPTAELKPGQTDQDTLPEYDVLDEILRRTVELQESQEEIVSSGFDRATVEKVVRMVLRSEYKRWQAAPGLKVTVRAFGSGWRMPIAMQLRYL